MASYRPYPPAPQQSSFGPIPPAQNPLPPPLPRPPSQGSQFPQNWGSAPFPPQNYNQIPPNSNFQHSGYGSTAHSYQPQPPTAPQQQPQQYPFPPPPPPPDSSYAPPPPPPPSATHQQYYPSSQYSQFTQQPLQPLQPPPPPPPPPPSSPPPSSSVPPPPPLPLSSPPPPPQAKESGQDRGGRNERDRRALKEGNHHHVSSRQKKPPIPPGPGKKGNGDLGRVETEEERKVRKKREMEKQRQEEKHMQQLKEAQNRQKPQILASGAKGHGSISGSRIGERRAVPAVLSGGGDRDENPLKRQTTFMCRMKFRNELPDPSAQPKLMTLNRDKDRFTRYAITSLEKMHKPKLYVEPDLGIPLDLLDLSVYKPPKEKIRHLDPEDEELLRDDEPVTPLKKDGIKRKERPSDQGVSWLVKTQYISPLSNEAARQSLTEKQAKELREMREGRNFLENHNSRDRQIKEILASFEACKSRPVHATNKGLQPVEVLPLLPYFDRYDDQFVVANFDGEPTADSEMFSKTHKSVREDSESKAIMKSFTTAGSNPDKPERFLGYMVPSQDELSKDIYDEDEDVSYSWVREYNWDVKGEDLDDLSTYVVTFDEDVARYMPLPTKLQLRKRRSKEGRSQEEGEQFVQPGKLTVRRRDTTSVIEQQISVNHSYSRAGPSNSRREESDIDEEQERMGMDGGDEDMGQFSGAEDYMSE